MKTKIDGENRIDFQSIEEKWRPYWDNIDLYQTGQDPNKPNIYILDYFPYPSGEGLSVGHCRNYVPTCVSSRFHRMSGYNVLHPMGWDAFGLPAENYAIKHDIHPQQSSAQFCATYRRQMKLIACSYDWSREIDSTDPDYYRWTQWFFLLLYKRGLAYRAEGSQWFCPQDKTILANEQVEDGRCWRCGTLVVRKTLMQWYFKITDYAERLLKDLDTIDWPQSIKTSQRNWIGRSSGAEIRFKVADSQLDIVTFTTRPDTLYGVTFIAVAPEYRQLSDLCSAERTAACEAYVQQSLRRSEIDRAADSENKTGVFTGRHAIHPLTGARIPIWIADYVLPGYGSGAVMGVPAHDQRDYHFAQAYDLPVISAIQPEQEMDTPFFSGCGTLINSGPYNGLPSETGAEAIIDELQTRGIGQKKVIYKMRDWLISRQRYWGAPIPMIYCSSCGIVPVPERELPLRLPQIDDFSPSVDGRSPLARAREWVHTTCPECRGPAQRETDTMDGFACSSWYFLRFTSPHYQEGPFEEQAMRRWMPVDSYVGGAEHAVMHLLYSRFWTKVMHDAGLVPFIEPFSSLRNQGMLLSAVDGQKMSKSKGNVITPDQVVAEHGTDALRAYILFLGPFDAEVTWDEQGIKGITRFLNRYWRLANNRPQSDQKSDEEQRRLFERRRHQIIKRVTQDMADFRFNTAVAALMSYLNYLVDARETCITGVQWDEAVATLTLLLCPIAPFITEEVWQSVLGNESSVHQQTWPQYDPHLAQDEEVTIVIQINGRVRDRVVMPVGTEETIVREKALRLPAIQRYIDGKNIGKVVVVKDRVVNIVV